VLSILTYTHCLRLHAHVYSPLIGSAAGDFSSLCYNLCCIANNHHKGAAAYTTHKK